MPQNFSAAQPHAAPEVTTFLYDQFERPLMDLRLSLTDSCNFRCPYCMPKNSRPLSNSLHDRLDLTLGERLRLIKILAELGVSKIRITGGEPLLYPHLLEFIRDIRKISLIHDIALTTNGSLLRLFAAKLKHAGLHRLTVSVNTLDKNTFAKMTGRRGRLNRVLDGIHAAESAGFSPIKINAVVQKGINDRDIVGLTRYFTGQGHIVRFIEYMDTGITNDWQPNEVMPNSEILAVLQNHFFLEAVEPQRYGETATRYRVRDGKGEVGFISSVSNPFCSTCTRLRLSADGKIYTCLFSAEGKNLAVLLRDGASDAEIKAVIAKTWGSRADKYSENRSLFRSLNDPISRLEMYQIGG